MDKILILHNRKQKMEIHCSCCRHNIIIFLRWIAFPMMIKSLSNQVFSEGGAGLRARGCRSPSSWVSTCPWWSRGGGSSTASCPGLTLSPSISRYWGIYHHMLLIICYQGYCNLFAHCCSFQGLVIGKLGQKRVIARVVRRTVMRKLFSCQQFILGIFYLNFPSYLLAVKWEIFWSEFQSRWWLNIILKILSPLIHSMYQTVLLKTQEEVSRHGGAE